MASTAALDSESAQLLGWLRAFERQHGQGTAHPQVEQVKARLKAIDDARKADKRQAKRARKLWGTVLGVIDEHDAVAGGHLRNLAKSPNDAAALAGVGAAIASVASKDARIAAIAKVALPAIQTLFVDNDDDTTE